MVLQLSGSFVGIPSIAWYSAIVVFGVIALIFDVAPYFLRRRAEYESDLALGRKHGCQLPPELPKNWPLGLDWLKKIWDANAKGQLLAFFDEVATQYEPGNNVSQFFLLGPRAYHVMTGRNVEAVLSTNFKDFGFGLRKSVFAPLLGNGIFTQEGPAWKHSRELLRKQFVKAQYQNLNHFEEHADNLIAKIPTEGTLDLQPLFFKFTLDTSTALLFGHSVYSLKGGDEQDADTRRFARSFDIAQEGLVKRFRLVPFHNLYNPREFREACQDVHRFVEQYIDMRSSKGAGAADNPLSWFIDQLAEATESKADLRDQLINVLLAGRDTTACCLSWTFRLLVRHPEVLQRLREEVRSVMQDQACPTREQIKRMPFLGCVLNESLRLYPPVPSNARRAINTTILPVGGGPDGADPILVRKGEDVIFGSYITSRRENIWKNAREFHPERWQTSEPAHAGHAFFPFNIGPRICLGQDFALMEISYTIIRLLQEFPTIELPPGTANEPIGTEKQRLTLVLSSADGCKVRISRSRN